VEDCATYGIQIGADGALVGFEGPMTVAMNTIKNTGAGIYFTHVSKDFNINNNEILGGTHGIQATVDVTNAVFTLDNNYLSGTNSGGYPLVIFGASKVHLLSGIYNNEAGGAAINLGADTSTNKIGEVLFDREHNFIRNGTEIFSLAGITKWVGPIKFFADATSYPADIGTRFTDLTSGREWIKRSNNGSTNGWAANGPDKWIPDTDVDRAQQWFSHDGTNNIMAVDASHRAVIIGPANTWEGYRLNIGEKY
jgi:hypothetical protein